MDLIVTSDGAGGWTARLGDRQFRCALGPAGPRRDKRDRPVERVEAERQAHSFNIPG